MLFRSMSWNPEQYLKFSQPRLRPAMDLLARIPAPSRSWCTIWAAGPATSPRRWWSAGRARIIGVDGSAAMLAQAARHCRRCSGYSTAWTTGRPSAGRRDLLERRSALAARSRQLFPALVRSLSPGGVLAIQMPRNFSAPSHTLIEATAREGPWRDELAVAARVPRRWGNRSTIMGCSPHWPPAWTSGKANICRCSRARIRSRNGPKAPGCMQFLDRLEPAERAAFEADYARRLRAAYPRRRRWQHAVPVPPAIHRAAKMIGAN